MDFTFNKEQDMIRKDIREFSKHEITPKVADIDEGGSIPNEIIKSMAKINLLCMSVSEKYGGLHADPVTVGIVAEELAKGDISCAIPTFFWYRRHGVAFLTGTEPRRQSKLYFPMLRKATLFLGSLQPNPMLVPISWECQPMQKRLKMVTS
jgi:alkylation response protein AidB-like acyl-CoA dehydrogenase